MGHDFPRQSPAGSSSTLDACLVKSRRGYGTPTASDSGAANKIYMKNTGSSSTDYFEVGLGTSSGSGDSTTYYHIFSKGTKGGILSQTNH